MVLGTSLLVQIEFSVASAADAAIHKNTFQSLWIWGSNTNCIKRRNKRHYGNSQVSIKMNQTRPVFNMIWQMEASTNYQEELGLAKYCVTKYLLLFAFYSMMDFNLDWHQRFTSVSIKKQDINEPELFIMFSNYSMNYIIPSLENVNSVKHTHLIEVTFDKLILQTCKY